MTGQPAVPLLGDPHAARGAALAPGGLPPVSFWATGGPEPVRFDHKVAPAHGRPADRFAAPPEGAGLVPFAGLVHDPASERGFGKGNARAGDVPGEKDLRTLLASTSPQLNGGEYVFAPARRARRRRVSAR